MQFESGLNMQGQVVQSPPCPPHFHVHISYAVKVTFDLKQGRRDL